MQDKVSPFHLKRRGLLVDSCSLKVFLDLIREIKAESIKLSVSQRGEKDLEILDATDGHEMNLV